MAGLSKSRIMSSLQCLKRVHLEIHRKDLLEYSKATEAVDGPLPKTPVGAHCTKPYGCPFMEFCWPNDTDYPVTKANYYHPAMLKLVQFFAT